MIAICVRNDVGNDIEMQRAERTATLKGELCLCGDVGEGS
jgi:hypothetical protein